MRDEAFWSTLTDEQASMILSCVANGQPLCCAVGHDNVRTIFPRARAKQRYLKEWAYEALGCCDMDPPHIERWLNTVMSAMGCGYADHLEEILAWEARRRAA